MTKALHNNLRRILVLPLPLLGVPDRKAIFEDFPDSLQRHALHVWI